jgi:hypothetical protein
MHQVVRLLLLGRICNPKLKTINHNHKPPKPQNRNIWMVHHIQTKIWFNYNNTNNNYDMVLKNSIKMQVIT